MATLNDGFSSAALVLDLPELLEMIISQLPPAQILLSQRVSKQWKLIIASPRQIQEKLFFRAVAAVLHPDPKVRMKSSVAYTKPFKTNLIVQNALNRSHHGLTVSEEFWHEFIRHSIQLIFTIDETLPQHRTLWNHPTATWKKMFVTGPPCSVLSMSYQAVASNTYWLAENDMPYMEGPLLVRDASGIRYGLIDDMIAKIKSTAREYWEDEDAYSGIHVIVTIGYTG